MEEITVVVIDDHPLIRQGVIDSLWLEQDMKIVGDAASGEEGLELIRQIQPRVAIIDINLPGLNGLQVTQQLISEKIPTRVLLITAYDDGEQRISALHAGATAYCTKDIQPEMLVQMVRDIASGQYSSDKRSEEYLQEDQLPNKVSKRKKPILSDPAGSYQPLSRREMEVLTYVSQGLSNKEIGLALRISEQTVKNHITAIFNKLGVNDRTQATLYALQRGWVRLGK